MRARGFTLFEFLVVVCLIAVLASVAAHKLFGVQVEAERAAVDMVLGNVRSAIGMKVAQEFAKDPALRVAALDGTNPMGLMFEPPAGYVGERTVAGSGALRRGEWAYDPAQKVLVYRVRNSGELDGGRRHADGEVDLRFRLSVLRERGTGPIYGVRLVELEPFAWKRQ